MSVFGDKVFKKANKVKYSHYKNKVKKWPPTSQREEASEEINPEDTLLIGF